MNKKTSIVIFRNHTYLEYIDFSSLWKNVWTGHNDINKNSDFINEIIANKYVYISNGIYQIRSEYFSRG